MKTELVQKAYEIAQERYQSLGFQVKDVLEKLEKIAISIHC
jgi:L-rhamnose isomerase